MGPLISVRGSSSADVAPDAAVVSGAIKVTRDSKREALEHTSAALDVVTAALQQLGGRPLSEAGRGGGLRYAVPAVRTYVEHEFDPTTGGKHAGSRTTAAADLVIEVRDFTLLDRLGSLLAETEPFETFGVQWLVDEANPAWATVRAEAIQAALRKGSDYAAALGTRVLRVEQVADAGLLDGSHAASGQDWAMATRAAAFIGTPDSPSLDPLPQTLVATIDARLATADDMA